MNSNTHFQIIVYIYSLIFSIRSISKIYFLLINLFDHFYYIKYISNPKKNPLYVYNHRSTGDTRYSNNSVANSLDGPCVRVTRVNHQIRNNGLPGIELYPIVIVRKCALRHRFPLYTGASKYTHYRPDAHTRVYTHIYSYLATIYIYPVRISSFANLEIKERKMGWRGLEMMVDGGWKVQAWVVEKKKRRKKEKKNVEVFVVRQYRCISLETWRESCTGGNARGDKW